MNKWQRLAAAFPLVMGIMDQVEVLRAFVGSKTSKEYDELIANVVDSIVTTVEIAVGKEIIDNAKLRKAVLAALDLP